MSELLEISDLIWPLDVGGRPGEVQRSATIGALEAAGQSRAARIVAALPHTRDVIDSGHLQALAFRVHAELSRLGEEMQLAARVADTLSAHLDTAPTGRGPITVIDVGCGLGHVLRTIAHRGLLPPDLRLVGMDLNATLITEASRLARREQLDVEFRVQDAFASSLPGAEPGRTIIISTGLLHHIAEPELPGFFAAHAVAGVHGFSHWDIAPSRWATLAAWVFHRARMREAVSRHDGVVSARRAHSSQVLAEASRHAVGYDCNVADEPTAIGRLVQVLRPVQGWRT